SCPAGEPAGFIVMYDFDAATAGMQDGRDLTLTALDSPNNQIVPVCQF
ncbi:hypothetical protein SAMN04489725_1231, partial [Alicyclobacillus hesperidum]